MAFEYRRKINYYETDKMGVAHHSNYIRFLEEVRCSIMEELDIPMSKFEAAGITIPTLEVNCRYKYHVTAGDVIVIRPWITEYNGIRMRVEYDVTEEKSGKTVIEASTAHCFTDLRLRPVNLRKAEPAWHEKFAGLLEEARREGKASEPKRPVRMRKDDKDEDDRSRLL
jgi:acyl-CoA thioester hydrolase